MMTDAQQRVHQKLEILMAQRALLPEAERPAVSAVIKAVADQIARLVAIASGAVERPLPDVVGEWVPTPREEGPPQTVRWPPPAP